MNTSKKSSASLLLIRIDCSPESIAMTHHHPYRVRHCPLDAGEYGFAFIRWTLNTIAILIVSAAMFIGLVISSAIHWV
jgi:hypothetical protein